MSSGKFVSHISWLKEVTVHMNSLENDISPLVCKALMKQDVLFILVAFMAVSAVFGALWGLRHAMKRNHHSPESSSVSESVLLPRHTYWHFNKQMPTIRISLYFLY